MYDTTPNQYGKYIYRTLARSGGGGDDAKGYNSLVEMKDAVERFRGWAEKGNGPMVLEQRDDLLEQGQILALGFGMDAHPNLDESTVGLLDEAVALLYTPQTFAEFAETGDASLLPKIPGSEDLHLLVPLDENIRGHKFYDEQRN
jgi:hypothetical protein